MIVTLKETFSSLSSKTYGQTIIKKTIGQSLWYWSKYVIAVGILVFVVLTGLIFYYTPQAARLLDENLPNIDLSVKNGQATSSTEQPYQMGDSDFMFILDTKGTSTELDPYKSGLLILGDRILAKKNSTETQEYKLKDMGDFQIDKQTIISAFSKNKYTLATTLILISVIFVVFMVSLYWLFNLLSFLVSGFLLLIFAKIIHRKIIYTDSLKIVIHAAVISMLVSPISPALSLGLFLIYSCVWIYNLSPLLRRKTQNEVLI